MKRVVSIVKVMFHTFGACSKSRVWCFKRALVRHPGNSRWNCPQLVACVFYQSSV